MSVSAADRVGVTMTGLVAVLPCLSLCVSPSVPARLTVPSVTAVWSVPVCIPAGPLPPDGAVCYSRVVCPCVYPRRPPPI